MKMVVWPFNLIMGGLSLDLFYWMMHLNHQVKHHCLIGAFTLRFSIEAKYKVPQRKPRNETT